jgi:hypothetical protein
MPQVQTMSLDEKLSISNRAIELKRAGDREGYERLMKTIPLPSYHAKVIKETIGLDYLINGGWNLTEAEAEFGPNWLAC